MTTTIYQVKGMTCDHCVGSVSEELGRIDGVARVEVHLATGEVTVASAAPLDESVVRAAVNEAGYEVVG